MVPWSNTSKSTAQLEVTFAATTNYDIYNTSMWAFTAPHGLVSENEPHRLQTTS